MKVLVLYLIGLVWMLPLRDHNYNTPIITDFKYEQIITKMRQANRLTCFSRFMVWLLYVLLKNQHNLFKHLRRRGVRVVLWTANTPQEF